MGPISLSRPTAGTIPDTRTPENAPKPEMVSRLRDTFVGIWHDADPQTTTDVPAYTSAEQGRNEVELEAFVDLLTHESRRAGCRRNIDAAGERRIVGAFARLATGALRWDGRQIEPLLSNGFRDALRAFPVRARRFDPSLRPADIYQAARNALTMHCLQSLLGVPVESTPAVVGYSLLYPYTDNLLDDESLDSAAKMAFSRRLSERLRGREVAPADPREACIFDLVAMIEGQFSRARFPEVFASLLAIHHAQERSVALLGGAAPLPRRTIVEIGVEKGGTSVLADGYLVAGALTPAQAECVFGLGVFLQLRDDLEDVEDDEACGLATVFSARPDGCLDEPTARALAAGRAVLDRLECFDAPSARPVREMMARSLQLTISDAAASFPARYTPAYLDELERRSPFRFVCLAAERKRLTRAKGSLTGLLESWIAEEVDVPSALDVIPFAEPAPGRC
jgi:hypothetical protein